MTDTNEPCPGVDDPNHEGRHVTGIRVGRTECRYIGGGNFECGSGATRVFCDGSEEPLSDTSD